MNETPQAVVPEVMATPAPAPTPWFKRKRFVIPAAVLGLAIIGSAMNGGNDGKPTTPAAVSATTTKAAPTKAAPPPEPPAPTYDTPSKSDFRIGVKLTRKQCFGSAGCNIQVKTTLTNVTGVKLDPGKTYEVTYELLGDESGPIVDTMEIQGDQYTGGGTQFLSTPSSGAKVSARIISLDES